MLIDFVNSQLIFLSLSLSRTLYLPCFLSLWTWLWEMCPVVASLTLLGDRDAPFILMFLLLQIKSLHDKRNKRCFKLMTFKKKKKLSGYWTCSKYQLFWLEFHLKYKMDESYEKQITFYPILQRKKKYVKSIQLYLLLK